MQIVKYFLHLYKAWTVDKYNEVEKILKCPRDLYILKSDHKNELIWV
jgi:hypothetical protein